jgi:uncharacterized membrane protein YgcG
VDIVLGVSMAPSAIRLVLVEGQNADGVTVDEDEFDVGRGVDGDVDYDTATAPTPASVSDRVVSAILGTRESASEGGFRLTSTGVTCSDQAQAAILRDALAGRKIGHVMLVSAFLAAAALAQTVGNLTGYARTGLLFIEPDIATLAVIDSADGSIAEVHRRLLPVGDDAALAELVAIVSGAEGLQPRPDGVFVVGSGVDVARIKPKLAEATALPVNAPEEPEMALARGAALASAHAPLFASSTRALAWARDPGTGEVDPSLIALGYAEVPTDSDATQGKDVLAYSAVPDGPDDGLLVAETDASELTAGENHPRWRPLLLTGSALAALFVVGATALVISLAVSLRPTADLRLEPGQNVVVPTSQAPAPPPKAQQPAPQPLPSTPAVPTPKAPQPSPVARPVPPAPAPAKAAAPAPEAPAPAPEAPAPAPEAPAPAPAPVAPPPAVPVVPVPLPIPIYLPPIPVAPAAAPTPAAPPAPRTPAPTVDSPKQQPDSPKQQVDSPKQGSDSPKHEQPSRPGGSHGDEPSPGGRVGGSGGDRVGGSGGGSHGGGGGGWTGFGGSGGGSHGGGGGGFPGSGHGGVGGHGGFPGSGHGGSGFGGGHGGFGGSGFGGGHGGFGGSGFGGGHGSR